MSKKLLIVPVMLALLAAGCNSNATKDAGNMSPKEMRDAATQPTDSSKTEDQNTTPQSTNSVEIKDYKFNPQTITVKKGTTVTWTNQDTVKHNVLTQGANVMTGPKSELLGQGQSYTYTFNTTGTYNYICGPHPYMTGTVIVTE